MDHTRKGEKVLQNYAKTMYISGTYFIQSVIVECMLHGKVLLVKHDMCIISIFLHTISIENICDVQFRRFSYIFICENQQID